MPHFHKLRSSAEGGEETYALPCGHCYHMDCLRRNCDVHGVSLQEMRCPECRETPRQVTARAIALENPVEIPDTVEDLGVIDIVEEPPVVAAESALAADAPEHAAIDAAAVAAQLLAEVAASGKGRGRT